MKRQATIITILVLSVLQSGFAQKKDYKDEISEWIRQREKQLTSIESPLSYVDLLWLKQGKNTFGSAADNDLILPASIASAHAGQYVLSGDTVSLILADQNISSTGRERVLVREIPTEDVYKYKPSNKSIVLTNKSYQWFLINNKGRLGVRVFDSRSPEMLSFKGVQRFPSDSTYKVKGIFEPYQTQTYRQGLNVVGKETINEALGLLKFTLKGQQYALEPFESNGQFFVVFSDKTGEDESYPFRFLYIPKPAKGRDILIDFNHATNPNCAFSKFSFCPMPPEQNQLSIAIPAGEKKYTQQSFRTP